MTTLKPPFAYYGGKTTLAERIVDLLPAHRHYVEPFAGSLAVLLAKPPSLMETVNDLDGHLMTFWRVLRDQPDDLMRVCALTPHSRAEHQAAYGFDAADDLERARRVWVCLTQGRGNTLRKTGWRHFQDPGRRGPTSMPDYLTSYVERMRGAAARLAPTARTRPPVRRCGMTYLTDAEIRCGAAEQDVQWHGAARPTTEDSVGRWTGSATDGAEVRLRRSPAPEEQPAHPISPEEATPCG